MKKRVLIVGMLDSIHLARWLSQFRDSQIEFLLFPSRTFRSVHPKLTQLIKDDTNFHLFYRHIPTSISGYFDYLLFTILKSIFRHDFRRGYLRRTIRGFRPEFLHAIEIQSGGYLCDEVIHSETKPFKFILTNWGSDIFYFQQDPSHIHRIKSALSKSDYYSAECARDYKLATSFGFQGVMLPCIPNAGGFPATELAVSSSIASMRSNIIVKAYGGTFGRGGLAINVLSDVLVEFPKYTVFLYSVTADLLDSVSRLSQKFPGRIQYSKQSEPISQDKLRSLFSISRVYIGCSASDGISTSFLESLTTGAYPIQTNTSCAGEWLEKGAVGSLIPLEKVALVVALRQALINDSLVDEAQKINLEVSQKYLNYEYIKNIAKTFYSC